MMPLRQLALVLLLVTSFSGVSFGQTLFERSLAQFQAKSLKVPRDNYAFVVLGDSRDGEAMFRKVLRAAKSYDPLFILHGGDYSGHGGEKETAAFLALVREEIPDVPLFVLQGNHESRAVFARHIGPAYFTLKSKRLGLDLIAVDDSDYRLRAQDLDYISRELSSGARNKFLAMHVPPKTQSWNWHTFSDGADRLKDLLSAKPADALFFSHVHLFDKSHFAGVPAYITGGAGAPLVPFGFPGDAVYHFVLVTVKKGKVGVQKIVVPEKP